MGPWQLCIPLGGCVLTERGALPCCTAWQGDAAPCKPCPCQRQCPVGAAAKGTWSFRLGSPRWLKEMPTTLLPCVVLAKLVGHHLTRPVGLGSGGPSPSQYLIAKAQQPPLTRAVLHHLGCLKTHWQTHLTKTCPGREKHVLSHRLGYFTLSC